MSKQIHGLSWFCCRKLRNWICCFFTVIVSLISTRILETVCWYFFPSSVCGYVPRFNSIVCMYAVCREHRKNQDSVPPQDRLSTAHEPWDAKVSFFGMCSKMQIIPIKNLNIKKVVLQFLWFFRLKRWFKGQIISRIHLSLPNAYKLMCFDRNINGNRDVNFLIGIIGHCTDQRKLL